MEKIADKSLGEVAFDAYCESTGGQTYDKRRIPDWSDLTERIQAAWQAAAAAVAFAVLSDDKLNGKR